MAKWSSLRLRTLACQGSPLRESWIRLTNLSYGFLVRMGHQHSWGKGTVATPQEMSSWATFGAVFICLIAAGFNGGRWPHVSSVGEESDCLEIQSNGDGKGVICKTELGQSTESRQRQDYSVIWDVRQLLPEPEPRGAHHWPWLCWHQSCFLESQACKGDGRDGQGKGISRYRGALRYTMFWISTAFAFCGQWLSYISSSIGDLWYQTQPWTWGWIWYTHGRSGAFMWMSLALGCTYQVHVHLHKPCHAISSGGYMLEWLLSFDNLFVRHPECSSQQSATLWFADHQVFHLIFNLYGTPDHLKHRPLYLGLLGGRWLMPCCRS